MRSRRSILRAGGAALISGIASPAIAKALPGQVRSVAFDNLHTGEKIAVDYWIEGQYAPDALNAVNHVLRDYRNGEVHVIDPKLLDL
jgi:uncharacterized protein YcbK (DUF882 family)